jgi:hypothetical protein
MKNLSTCVQTLVANGAYLFVENFEHSTPCDLAERNGHKDIALYLESKMIFSVNFFFSKVKLNRKKTEAFNFIFQRDDDEKELDDQEVTLIEDVCFIYTTF